MLLPPCGKQGNKTRQGTQPIFQETRNAPVCVLTAFVLPCIAAKQAAWRFGAHTFDHNIFEKITDGLGTFNNKA